MSKIFNIFIVAFLITSVAALVASLVLSKDTTLSKNCKSTSWTAFAISLILIYLQFVLA